MVLLYAVIRVDKRFHVPNGSHAPGDYSGANRKPSLGDRVLSEESVFDDQVESDRTVDVEKRSEDVEAGIARPETAAVAAAKE